jgi:hypothetical protein
MQAGTFSPKSDPAKPERRDRSTVTPSGGSFDAERLVCDVENDNEANVHANSNGRRISNSTPVGCAQFLSRGRARRAGAVSRHLPAHGSEMGRSQHRSGDVHCHLGRPPRADACRRSGRCDARQAGGRGRCSAGGHSCLFAVALAANVLAGRPFAGDGTRCGCGISTGHHRDHARRGGAQGLRAPHRPQRVVQSRR